MGATPVPGGSRPSLANADDAYSYALGKHLCSKSSAMFGL